MKVEDLLLDGPYDFKEADTYKKNYGLKEVAFIIHNNLKCPVCAKPTRMAKIHCQNCGADMHIPKDLFVKLLRTMMNDR